MSRWWPDRIRIALHADRAALVRWSGRGRAPVASQLLSFSGDASPDQIGQLLSDALSQPGWRHGAISVVLSHALCRLALVPGGIDVRGRQEEDALYRNCIEEANGELPSGWHVSAADAPAHLSRPVCAIDGLLVAALDAAAAASGGRIASLRPYLADAYNAHRSGLGMGRYWFAIVERERASLIRLQDGVWHSLRVKRLFDDPETELGTLLRQERVLAGDEPAPDGLLLCAPNHPELRAPPGFAAAPLQDALSIPSSRFGLAAADFGMALEGVL